MLLTNVGSHVLASVQYRLQSGVPLADSLFQFDVFIKVLYLWAIMFATLSILALYTPIFAQADQLFRWTCHVITGKVIMHRIACTPLYVFDCLPSGARSKEQVSVGNAFQ